MSLAPEPDLPARRRAVVLAYLKERSTRLSGLFELACDLVEDQRPDGWVHVVGHVGRELTNRLVDHLDGVPVASQQDASPVGAQQIADRLHPVIDGDAEQLRQEAKKILEEIAEGRRVTGRRAARLIGADSDQPDDPAEQAWIREWRRLHRAFQAVAHLPARPVGEAAERDLAAAWHDLIDVLAVRVAEEPFFDSMDELVELAAGPPDVEGARRALARLRTGTQASFYAALSDPAWVSKLADAGVFAHPPVPAVDGEFVSYPGWPEGMVLLRFAASNPEAVAAAAAGVPPSVNVRVAQVLAAVAAELPADLAADRGLAARVAADLRGDAQLLDLGEPAGRLAQHLAEAGRGGKARAILDALLRVDVRITSSGSEFLPDFRHGALHHDEYLVAETVGPLINVMVDREPIATIKCLVGSLEHAQSKLGYGSSTRWRRAITDSRALGGEDPRHLLVELLRDACELAVSRDPTIADQLLDLLNDQESEIFARLGWHLLAELPDQAPRRRAVLTDPRRLFSADGSHEIRGLLAMAFVEMSPEDNAEFRSLIIAGPDPDDHGLSRDQSPDAGAWIDLWQDRWRQWLLSAVASSDPEAANQLRQLRELRGALDPPGQAVRTESWVGPTSPVSRQQLGEMNADDVIALLHDFCAQDSFRSPSPSGLTREIARAVGADPSGWMWLADRLGEIAPAYVRGWLSGLQEVVRADGPLPQPTVVAEALRWLLAQDADPDAQTPSRDGDPDHYEAQRIGADLLVSALGANQFELSDRALLWSLIERLVADQDPTPQREASTDTPPMQLAWSALRAIGAVAVVRYIYWLDLRLPDDQRPGVAGFAAIPETRGVLDRLITEDQSRAVRAGLAAELPVLASLDRDWLSDIGDALVDPAGEDLARVGWEAYLHQSNVLDICVEVIADAYRRAAAQTANCSGELTQVRRDLADHVAVIWRDLPDAVPGLMTEFMSNAPDVDRARVIATLGRSLRLQSETGYEPTPTELERFRGLWDERLGDDPGPLELAAFGWWWTSGRFNRAADLRRLTTAVSRGGHDPAHMRAALGLLDELLASDAALAGDTLTLLETLGNQNTLRAHYIDADVLRRLLAPALAAAELRERAVALVHRLGETGYVMLRELLD